MLPAMANLPSPLAGAEESSPLTDEPMQPNVAVKFTLPFVPHPKAIDHTDRPVPDVSALTLRDAVRALHRSGFRVRLIPQRGTATVPPAGTPLAAGSVVKLQHIQ